MVSHCQKDTFLHLEEEYLVVGQTFVVEDNLKVAVNNQSPVEDRAVVADNTRAVEMGYPSLEEDTRLLLEEDILHEADDPDMRYLGFAERILLDIATYLN
jgi:hypothetical protein